MIKQFQRSITITGLALALAAFAGSGIAAAPPEVASCAGCHGANGMGNKAANFPALAGQHAPYLEQQLYAFKHGTRVNSIMKSMAVGLTPATRAKIGAYYASLPVTPMAEPSPAPTGLGAQIAMRGLNPGTPHAIPSCDACHGAGGLGHGWFPRLAGQSQAYLAGQLVAWQKGTRSEAPSHTMRDIARKLSPADIQAVTTYYAELSPNPAPGAPAKMSPKSTTKPGTKKQG